MKSFLSRLLCVLLLVPLLPLSALGEEDKAFSPVTVPSAYPVPDYVERLLECARREIGYTEERSGVTKYGTWSGEPTAEWCAEYLCWCVEQTDKLYNTHLTNQVYPKYSGTNVGRNWFLKQGRYIARSGLVPGWGAQWYKDGTPVLPNSYIPQPGDWVFFCNNAVGDTSHVAMVEFCAYDENGEIRVHVLEGNNPDAVARNSYAVSEWSIQGYGTVHALCGTVMRFGNEGEPVKALQGDLVALGLLDAQYTTGKYGALTQGAIEKFQRSYGLEPNGVANYATQEALDAVLRTAQE